MIDTFSLISLITTMLAVCFSNMAMILWFRAESRQDLRHMDAKLESNSAETRTILSAIKDEMRDFHSRLATQDLEFKIRMSEIEEKRKFL